MTPRSPAEALGPNFDGAREALVETIRSVHDRFAEGHMVIGSKHALGFGTQWIDLLDAVHDEVTQHGFLSHQIPKARKVPIVNDSLIYTWRVTSSPNAVRKFAAGSQARLASFKVPTPDSTLFEAAFPVQPAPLGDEDADCVEMTTMLSVVRDPMPVVLVMVNSTPQQLLSIDWAVATLDDEGLVELHGQECIWQPELVEASAAPDGTSFSDGVPAEVQLEPREQRGPGPRA